MPTGDGATAHLRGRASGVGGIVTEHQADPVAADSAAGNGCGACIQMNTIVVSSALHLTASQVQGGTAADPDILCPGAVGIQCGVVDQSITVKRSAAIDVERCCIDCASR
ncbi:hypothetical protein D3C80_1544430 [compost metagenome]